MNENELRGVIRKQIRKVLSEAPRLGAGGAELERGLGKIGDRTSRFSRRQRVQAILPVLKKFNIEISDIPYIKGALAKMMKADAAAVAEPEVEENYTAGIDDGDAGSMASSEAGKSLEEGSLDDKADKLDDSNAFKLLKNALGNKSAGDQAKLVFTLIDKLGLKDGAKKQIRMKAKQIK